MNIGSIFLPLLLAPPLVAQVVGTWELASRPDLPALIELATATMKQADRLYTLTYHP